MVCCQIHNIFNGAEMTKININLKNIWIGNSCLHTLELEPGKWEVPAMIQKGIK